MISCTVHIFDTLKIIAFRTSIVLCHVHLQNSEFKNIKSSDANCRLLSWFMLISELIQIDSHKLPRDKKPYQCTKCYGTVKLRHQLTSHVLLHRGESFKCNKCDHASKKKRDPTKHIKLFYDQKHLNEIII